MYPVKDSPGNVDYLGFGRGYDGGNVVSMYTSRT
jgi:hypothetical protein